MRILHVGWGFSPWRPGGLITYAEDVMAAQVAAGHDVSYFFSGRHYPIVSGPRLKRWRRGGVAMNEVINGPIVAGMELGTRTPERELHEPWTEAAFRRLVRSFRPEVVHVQELLGMPSSVLEIAAEEGTPVLMTLQDYFPLCATLRLLDADGRLCTRLQVGEDCVARNTLAPEYAAVLLNETLKFEIARWRRWLRVPGWVRVEAVADSLKKAFFDWTTTDAGARPLADPPPLTEQPELAAAFQRRRDLNVERLSRVDRLIAQSPRVAEIYAARGVAPERMTTLPFTLAHIDGLRPRTLASPPDPIRFVTLQGCASEPKGYGVVAGALRSLREAGLEGRFRLRVLGFVHPDVRGELEGYDGVELGWFYERHQLDALLDDADVGLMPSTWEEALGYTGLELVAKGLPLIANPLGGIVEYAREGETAWLNRSCTGEGMAEIMARLIADPGQVLEMHARVREARDRVVQPFARHVSALDAVYRELAVS